MKRQFTTIIAIILLLGTAFTVNARTIKDLFVAEPGEVFPLLSQRSRLDMVDYLNAGRMVEVDNNLAHGTRFNKVTDTYMSVRVSGSSMVELLLMPISKKDSVIVAVTTVELPAKDSRIAFYNTKWEQLDSKSFMPAITMQDFIAIPKGDKTKKETILDAIEFPIISYSIDPESRVITARQGLKDYMSKEDYDRIAPYLTDTITLTPKGKKYTKN